MQQYQPTIDDLDQCKNTSGDTTGANCPDNAKRGWYSLLDVHDGVPGNVQDHKEKCLENLLLVQAKFIFQFLNHLLEIRVLKV